MLQVLGSDASARLIEDWFRVELGAAWGDEPLETVISVVARVEGTDQGVQTRVYTTTTQEGFSSFLATHMVYAKLLDRDGVVAACLGLVPLMKAKLAKQQELARVVLEPLPEALPEPKAHAAPARMRGRQRSDS